MLHFDTKREAVARLESSIARYHELAGAVLTEATRLHHLRDTTSREIIGAVERYVNELANAPKEFDRSISEFKVALDQFDGVIQKLKLESQRANVSGAIGTAAALGLGAATMTVAPAAAMGIATTFGAASTGTAIAALSGAAQASAATAWLGGGSLAAGGGGIAGGAKLLVILGGPIGWGLGAMALAGTGCWTRYKNAAIAQRATTESEAVEAKVAGLKNVQKEIERLSELTKKHGAGIQAQLAWLKQNASADYSTFSPDAKHELSGLINSIRVMAKLLNTQVG